MSTQNTHTFGRRLWAGAVVVGLTMLPVALIHSAQARSTKDGAVLVSRASGKSGAAGGGVAPSLSRDGRFVAFESSTALTGEPLPSGTGCQDSSGTSCQVFLR